MTKQQLNAFKSFCCVAFKPATSISNMRRKGLNMSWTRNSCAWMRDASAHPCRFMKCSDANLDKQLLQTQSSELPANAIGLSLLCWLHTGYAMWTLTPICAIIHGSCITQIADHIVD